MSNEKREKVQMLEITGKNSYSQMGHIKTHLDVEARFQSQHYPQEMSSKEIEFLLDPLTCSSFVSKFV